jgi:hypothetical protein
LGTTIGNLSLQQSGSDTIITSAAFAGSTIALQGIAAASLHPDDFIF